MDTFSRVAIIAALDTEVELLAETLEEAKQYTFSGGTYLGGRIGGTEVIVYRCGIGKVSAASGTQELICRFSPDCVINTGCAGGIAGGMHIGDLVIANAAVEWDLDTIAIGNPRGYIDSLNTVEIEADRKLSVLLKGAIPAERTVHEGLVASGDQFVSTDEQRKLILGAFPKALCAEMEGAAVAHVCAGNHVPFAIIRCMSDTADHDSSVDFAQFSAEAGRMSAGILIRMLRNE